ncbi:probable transcriptional regulatory protein TDE_1487 [Saccostrea echinata]|uniref:probable transcriptional regulatory protein TDE_1487 n=1 Tax=Saccostrea echinata TaxID=191078 RepID=UPI002A7EADF8|nr:probable transcriptional regulatory protein TDE_1487 [Saccostrea echinata]
MSGHSKWSTIKHKKGAADAKRGKLFTKLIKEITVAARMGGPDPEGNPRLRACLIKARTANMPRDNIERAIKKGIGDPGGRRTTRNCSMKLMHPAEWVLLIEALTENKNRSAADIRSILSKNCLRRPLEAGAEDVADSGEVYTGPSDFEQVLEALEGKGFVQLGAEVQWVAEQRLSLSHDDTRKVLHLIDRLEDCDDVQTVASNLEIPEDFDFHSM